MSPNQPRRPRATIVIEWENVQLSEQSRCREMLRILSRQMQELDCSMGFRSSEGAMFELLVLYDSDKCDLEEVQSMVVPYLTAAVSMCKLRVLAAPGLTYYQQKNLGAREASADLVVYLDSDVIPENGWLAGILSPFADPSVEVVCGNSYLSYSSAYSKAFALFWFFPLRAQTAVFERRRTFFANNVAFRRRLLLSHPFAAVDGTTRGSCIALARELAANGIEIYCHSAAQVSHPAPNGLQHFLVRGLAQGRDHVFTRRALGKGAFFQTFPKQCLLPFRAIWKIVRHRRKVNLSLFEMPVAICVAIAYNLLAVAGELISHLAPGYARRRWQI
jgi:hypothetical protein